MLPNWLLRRLAVHERVHHTPEWVPTPLATGYAGTTKPGFECVHQLENGMGQCGGNVFRIEDEVGDHACIVRRWRWQR